MERKIVLDALADMKTAKPFIISDLRGIPKNQTARASNILKEAQCVNQITYYPLTSNTYRRIFDPVKNGPHQCEGPTRCSLLKSCPIYNASK